MVYSCTYQEKQEEFNCQVQGPMPTSPLHSRLEGFREGWEAKAVPPTKYVHPASRFIGSRKAEIANSTQLAIHISSLSPYTRDFTDLRYLTDLSIGDTPKKNAKGKRVAQ